MKKIALCIIACIVSVARASVVADHIQLVADSSFVSNGYTLTVYQDQAATNPAMIILGYTPSSVTYVTGTIDEGFDLYSASAGDLFSSATISAGLFNPFVIEDWSNTPPAILHPNVGSFYLGVNTGVGFSASGPNRQYFGWVELYNTGSGLNLISSGMSYDSSSVVVGAIPEPASYASLAALASGILVLAKRRRNHGA